MGRLIDINDLHNKVMLNKSDWGIFATQIDNLIESIVMQIPTVDAIPIPQDATNEDVLKAVFPNDADDIIKYIKTEILNGWLNSKYERLED